MGVDLASNMRREYASLPSHRCVARSARKIRLPVSSTMCQERAYVRRRRIGPENVGPFLIRRHEDLKRIVLFQYFLLDVFNNLMNFKGVRK